MPFGRHRGEYISGLPDDYLLWLSSIDLRPWLRDAVEYELHQRRREYAGGHSDTRQQISGAVLRLDAADVGLASEIVDLGYRAAARRHHPDMGGDAATMQRLNALVERMRSQLGAIAS